MLNNPGERFWAALAVEKPLQIPGVSNAYVALMARHYGYRALYLSGGGIANNCYGLPDLGMTTLDNVVEEASRITSSVDLPLLVDVDTGWGNHLMVARTIKQMARAQVAVVHIEDQVFGKRCGHRKGKSIISTAEMTDRILAAVDARECDFPLIMARTDALAVEGLPRTLERICAYVAAGAEMIFLEAFNTLEQYQAARDIVDVPLLANVTEFGQTPLFTLPQLAEAGLDIVLYPLSLSRMMNLAALRGLKTIRDEGSQEKLLQSMQTREELYGFLNYEFYENSLSRAP